MAELTDEIRQFLEEVRFAVVATINDDGTPQQTVLWYELQGDRIMVNTATGRVKEKNLSRDPRISLCVEDGYRYVTIGGRATLNYEQRQAQADIKALAIRYQGKEAGEKAAQNGFSKEERVSIYISIDKVDGRL
ncbi:MAG: PPOX class F420-dependent oxidoreductase [Chloroflexota bacterium]|nr:PPOX class F420-dependent oxidoreductase [Chloroflexota bacterium]